MTRVGAAPLPVAHADELPPRIILSQYLLRVNEAGDMLPQEVSAGLSRWDGGD